MGKWQTESRLAADVPPSSVWESAYEDAGTWSEWNREIASAALDGPLAVGARAKVKFRTGLRLTFTVVEYEYGRLFTDEARLPGARMGHRHLVEGDSEEGGDQLCRLTNRIYIEGPLTFLWQRVLGPSARRALPEAQEAIVGLARTRSSVGH